PLLSTCRWGARTSAYIGHELAIRDFRIWAELSARHHPGHQLERWRDGAAAEIRLPRTQRPRVLRADSWFEYRIGERSLISFLEIDRSTERGSKRWLEKLAAYQALFEAGLVRETTGFVRARVLVLTLDARRR